MEGWASGQVSEDTDFKNALMNAAAIRECQVLTELAAFNELDLEGIEI